MGIAKLKFENKRIKGFLPETLDDFKIQLNHNVKRKDEESYCGEVKIDFRVFDRDPGSIDGLIERGLKDPLTGQYVGKREARIILDTFNGIGVYRNGFRIRPLGDAGYDWLELDRERVQNPSKKIGSDQIIGFIHIESEKLSGLEEKSARDGLRETSEYFGLQEISKQVLAKLEERRFIYRQKVGLGRSNRHLTKKISNLYNFADLKNKIVKELESTTVDKKAIKKIVGLLSDKEKRNNLIADDLKRAIALYQGQATVGKIINVILHEGRKPLGYFKNQVPLISEWVEELEDQYEKELLEKVINRLFVIVEQSNIFIKLFEKLDPLSAKKRGRKKDFNVRKVIENVQDVFLSELEEQQISYLIDCDINLTCYGWKEDFYIVFTNLVDNSIYWFQGVDNREKIIQFNVYEEGTHLMIDYRDNGPGIDKDLIESEVIFEPEFSNKTGGGTGLGLAIAGEAIERNEGTLKAIYSEKWSIF